MDPLLGLGLIVAAVAALVAIRQGAKHVADKALIEAARKRSEQRAIERQYQDTTPNGVDHWANRLDMRALQTVEVDDRFDGRGALSVEQKQIVNVILEGVDVTYVDEVDKVGSVFSKANQVEYVDPWANTVQ